MSTTKTRYDGARIVLVLAACSALALLLSRFAPVIGIAHAEDAPIPSTTAPSSVTPHDGGIFVHASLPDVRQIDGCQDGGCAFWQLHVERQVDDHFVYYSSDAYPSSQTSADFDFSLPAGTYTKAFVSAHDSSDVGHCPSDDGYDVCPDGKAILGTQFGLQEINEAQVSIYPIIIDDAQTETEDVTLDQDVVGDDVSDDDGSMGDDAAYAADDADATDVADVEITMNGDTIDVIATGGNAPTQLDVVSADAQGSAVSDASDDQSAASMTEPSGLPPESTADTSAAQDSGTDSPLVEVPSSAESVPEPEEEEEVTPPPQPAEQPAEVRVDISTNGDTIDVIAY